MEAEGQQGDQKGAHHRPACGPLEASPAAARRLVARPPWLKQVIPARLQGREATAGADMGPDRAQGRREAGQKATRRPATGKRSHLSASERQEMDIALTAAAAQASAAIEGQLGLKRVEKRRNTRSAAALPSDRRAKQARERRIYGAAPVLPQAGASPARVQAGSRPETAPHSPTSRPRKREAAASPPGREGKAWAAPGRRAPTTAAPVERGDSPAPEEAPAGGTRLRPATAHGTSPRAVPQGAPRRQSPPPQKGVRGRERVGSPSRDAGAGGDSDSRRPRSAVAPRARAQAPREPSSALLATVTEGRGTASPRRTDTVQGRGDGGATSETRPLRGAKSRKSVQRSGKGKKKKKTKKRKRRVRRTKARGRVEGHDRAAGGGGEAEGKGEDEEDEEGDGVTSLPPQAGSDEDEDASGGSSYSSDGEDYSDAEDGGEGGQSGEHSGGAGEGTRPTSGASASPVEDQPPAAAPVAPPPTVGQVPAPLLVRRASAGTGVPGKLHRQLLMSRAARHPDLERSPSGDAHDHPQEEVRRPGRERSASTTAAHAWGPAGLGVGARRSSGGTGQRWRLSPTHSGALAPADDGDSSEGDVYAGEGEEGEEEEESGSMPSHAQAEGAGGLWTRQHEVLGSRGGGVPMPPAMALSSLSVVGGTGEPLTPTALRAMSVRQEREGGGSRRGSQAQTPHGGSPSGGSVGPSPAEGRALRRRSSLATGLSSPKRMAGTRNASRSPSPLSHEDRAASGSSGTRCGDGQRSPGGPRAVHGGTIADEGPTSVEQPSASVSDAPADSASQAQMDTAGGKPPEVRQGGRSPGEESATGNAASARSAGRTRRSSSRRSDEGGAPRGLMRKGSVWSSMRSMPRPGGLPLVRSPYEEPPPPPDSARFRTLWSGGQTVSKSFLMLHIQCALPQSMLESEPESPHSDDSSPWSPGVCMCAVCVCV